MSSESGVKMSEKDIIHKLSSELDFERSKRKTLQMELKAKEQECEELKEKCNKYQNEICPQYSEELKQAYTRANKAEQECEEYKHVLDSLEQFCKENKQAIEIAKDIVIKYREPYFKEKIEKENFDFFHKAEEQ